VEVQWFGLHASAAESMDSILDLGNEIPTCHMAQPPPTPTPRRNTANNFFLYSLSP